MEDLTKKLDEALNKFETDISGLQAKVADLELNPQNLKLQIDQMQQQLKDFSERYAEVIGFLPGIKEGYRLLIEGEKEQNRTIEKLLQDVAFLMDRPDPNVPVITWPFDAKNTKFTFSDGSELPWDEAMELNHKDLIFNPKEGSIRCIVDYDASGHTPNSDTPRTEAREYDDISTKADHDWDKPLGGIFGYVLNEVREDENAYIQQIHGKSTKPYMKYDVGKKKSRLLLGLTENAKKDTELNFDHEPIVGQAYVMEYLHVAKTITASLYFGELLEKPDGTKVMVKRDLIKSVQTDAYSRKDKKYRKGGAYGQPKLDVTLYPVLA